MNLMNFDDFAKLRVPKEKIALAPGGDPLDPPSLHVIVDLIQERLGHEQLPPEISRDFQSF